MADEERSRPFARSLPPPAQGGPSPFSRGPAAPAAVAGGVAVARPAPSHPVATPTAAPAAAAENLPMGFMAGLAAAGVGAGLWAAITLATGYQIGWMAVGVGALVGVAVRFAGKGTTSTFGIVGAALALGGCLIGNLLTGCVVLAREWGVSVVSVFTRLTPEMTGDLMTAMFSPIDLLFYALALYQGYKLSIVGGSSES